MRISLCLLVVALGGCASQSAPAPAPVTKQVKIDASNIVAVQNAGYKLVTKDGQQLYCREDAITGSRLQMRTSCFTEREMAEQMAATRQSMESFQMKSPAPTGK